MQCPSYAQKYPPCQIAVLLHPLDGQTPIHLSPYRTNPLAEPIYAVNLHQKTAPICPLRFLIRFQRIF